MKSEPLKLVPKTGTPCPAELIAGLEEIVAAAKSGEVTSFVACASGPDIERWRAGHVIGRADRHNLMAQCLMTLRQLEDLELESE